MRATKRIVKSQTGQKLLAWLAACYIRFVGATTRWTMDAKPVDNLLADGERAIACFWHGRLLMMPLAWKGRKTPIYMMISEHRDGLLIARTIAHMKLWTVGADSKTGSMSALREMKRCMESGGWVGITPDGPRGPRMRAKAGAVKLAQLSGRPLLPVTVGMSRRRVLGTWDRFVVAWPFGRGMFLFGDPIHVPRDADEAALEAARRELEDSLNAITREADRRLGVRPVEPAEEVQTEPAPASSVAGRAKARSA